MAVRTREASDRWHEVDATFEDGEPSFDVVKVRPGNFIGTVALTVGSATRRVSGEDLRAAIAEAEADA